LKGGRGYFTDLGWGEKGKRAARYKGGLYGTRTMTTKEEKGGVAMIKLMRRWCSTYSCWVYLLKKCWIERASPVVRSFDLVNNQ